MWESISKFIYTPFMSLLTPPGQMRGLPMWLPDLSQVPCAHPHPSVLLMLSFQEDEWPPAEGDVWQQQEPSPARASFQQIQTIWVRTKQPYLAFQPPGNTPSPSPAGNAWRKGEPDPIPPLKMVLEQSNREQGGERWFQFWYISIWILGS